MYYSKNAKYFSTDLESDLESVTVLRVLKDETIRNY